MSQTVDFEKAKGIIVETENIMSEIFPQWGELSCDARQFVMLRYAHLTFAFLAKERHDIDMSFHAVSGSKDLCINIGITCYKLSERDREIIDHSHLIWAAMPVVPNGSMTYSLDNSTDAMRFECDTVWGSLQEVYASMLFAQENGQRLSCVYHMIPVDENGIAYPEE